MERLDLAVDLNVRLGKWFKVLELLEANHIPGADKIREETMFNIGLFFFERANWEKAIPYFQKCHNFEKLVECYYSIDEFSEMQTIAESLLPTDPLLIVNNSRNNCRR
jgi:hypothetical protein